MSNPADPNPPVTPGRQPTNFFGVKPTSDPQPAAPLPAWLEPEAPAPTPGTLESIDAHLAKIRSMLTLFYVLAIIGLVLGVIYLIVQLKSQS